MIVIFNVVKNNTHTCRQTERSSSYLTAAAANAAVNVVAANVYATVNDFAANVFAVVANNFVVANVFVATYHDTYHDNGAVGYY